MTKTFVFGTGLRSDNSGTTAPVPIEPTGGEGNATVPMAKREPTRIYILLVKFHRTYWFAAPTREKLEERIRIRKYPERFCTIYEAWTVPELEPSAREISFLALELPESFDKRLYDNKLFRLGQIMDAGPKRLQSIGFDGDDIRRIRSAMKKHGLELPLLKPKLRATG
jgi:hypothetical protein